MSITFHGDQPRNYKCKLCGDQKKTYLITTPKHYSVMICHTCYKRLVAEDMAARNAVSARVDKQLQDAATKPKET